MNNIGVIGATGITLTGVLVIGGVVIKKLNKIVKQQNGILLIVNDIRQEIVYFEQNELIPPRKQIEQLRKEQERANKV